MRQTADELKLEPIFISGKKKAYDQIKWSKRDAQILNPTSTIPVFEQKDVEFPDDWSLNAVNIVTQKYFVGMPGTPERETSLKQLINRVVDTITTYGIDEGYFLAEEAEIFREELKYVLATQQASFNSPVWFNIGAANRTQQASACFILGLEDTMPSILNWYVEEGMIFKGGSGAGINLSNIRSSFEPLSYSAGTASGPLSFMRGADSSAGAIKSGGKTRRAAKMVILNVDHPDIEQFVISKVVEERKARVLQEAGFDMGVDGKDIFSVQYQNANISVRVTDDFMQAVVDDADWDLKAVTTHKTIKTVKAKELFRAIAQATWECADPGMQFDTTINKWNPTPVAGHIEASNPCSEYMHLNNSACNLASINLLKFLKKDNSFDIRAFNHTVDLLITAQEILVGYSTYPTDKITKTAKAYRELGIGYANLGALLMAQGIPYDSEEGRAQAAAITALMSGRAYRASAMLARRVGPFSQYHTEREAMLKVLNMHRDALSGIKANLVSEELLSEAASSWDSCIDLAEQYGVRNSQISLLAPTGTIALMMDCDTTGIEPDLGLVKVKKLVGGGTMNIVNQTVPRALKALGYADDQIKEIIAYIDVEKTIIGAPHLKSEHKPVFACSMGDNSIHYLGHVKMMSAVQPFLSGAISKTVNLPESATVEDIERLYIDAWQMGLKAVAIYRDNCKVGQPLSMGKKSDGSETDKQEQSVETASGDTQVVKRRTLPRTRDAKTFSFEVGGSHGYLTVGQYEDGTPGELFVNIAKMGSTLAGLMDSFARSVSYGLQYGVPLKTYVKGLTNMSFSPSGISDDPEIRTVSSLVDYIFRRLGLSYLSLDDKIEVGLVNFEDVSIEDTVEPQPQPSTQSTLINKEEITPTAKHIENNSASMHDVNAPLCYNCGNQTQRSGSCYVCPACGSTTGCS